MKPEAQRLSNVASVSIVTVPETASVAGARAAAVGAEWTVITDAESRPVRVLATAELEMSTPGAWGQQITACAIYMTSVSAMLGVSVIMHTDQGNEPRATSCRNNEHRPHQSREQRPPLHEPGQPVDVTARIKRGQVVRGLIGEYRRQPEGARSTSSAMVNEFWRSGY